MPLVLIIDSGARGEVLQHTYRKSVDNVVISKESNPESILEVARKLKPDLIDVAQDTALALGTVDLLQSHGFRAFGPDKNAAKIESSKFFSRRFMQRHNIPHPHFEVFDSEEKAIAYVSNLYSKNPKLVFIKADSLCKGKGVLKSTTLDEAVKKIRRMKEFGASGKRFLVEDGLTGSQIEEFSYYAISDGKTYKIFKSAQDNKTAFNFDQGPNTGGMGANSPALVTSGLEARIESQFILPVIQGMAEEETPFTGILYFGGIIVDGEISSIEYNARWGDPEVQVVLPGLQTDYFDLVNACLEGRLEEMEIQEDSKTRVCVVGASKGYPDDYSNVIGKRIYGLEEAMKIPGVLVFKAGINIQGEKLYAEGGRLFSIVAEGDNILEAKQKAYSAMAHVSVEGNNLHYRTDIGWRDIERTN